MQRAGLIRGTSLLLALACSSAGCEEDDDKSTSTGPIMTSDGGLPLGCTEMVNDRDCDRTKPPIVFVHGTSANADSFLHPALLLASNGYCADLIRGVEYNSVIARGDGGTDGGTDGGLDGGVSTLGGGLDAGSAVAADGGVSTGDGGTGSTSALGANYARAKAAIDEAIAQLRRELNNPTLKVDLLGHSQGASHASAYTGENPDKVLRYVNLAGRQLAADPGGVPTLCLSSTGDTPVNCATTENVIIEDLWLDHSAVASSTEAFVEIYKFYNNGLMPRHTTVQCGEPIMLEGRAPTLSDNMFLPGSKVEVYELADDPWNRGAPVHSFTIGSDGKFGPWQAQRGVQYEFKLLPPPGDLQRTRTIRAYLRPFIRSNRLLRFNMQSLDPSATATSSMLTLSDNHSVLIPRRYQKAFLFSRDTLTVGGHSILNEQNTVRNGESSVTAAIYVYDDGDGVTSGQPILPGGAFVRTSDVFLPATPPQFITVEFKEGNTFTSTFKIPNWPSNREGVSVVYVD